MKTGLTTSVVLHAALIAFGLFTLRAPHALEAADVEAMPVDVVPISSITQLQRGDKKAPKREKSAPKPTVKQTKVENAQKVGNNDRDLDKPPTPEARPKPVEATSTPPPAPKPAPQPAKEAKEEAPPKPMPAPAPAPVKDQTPQPKQEAKPKPTPQPKVAESPDAESVQLPNSAPSPDQRPQPPKPQVAKAAEQEKPKPEQQQQQQQKVARQQSQPKKDDTLDKVAALLNKEKPSGGGAKRSTEQASLGADHPTSGEKLTQSEMDALRGQIEKCWSVPAGADDAKDLKVSIKFKLDRSGALEGMPQIVSGGGSEGVQRAAAESARRAVMQCAPYNLPADKYDAWSDVIVNFDPSDMF